MTKYSTGHYVNGQWLRGLGTPFSSINPADGCIIWQGTNATEIEISEACNAAHRALPSWASLEVANRATYIQCFAKHIDAKRQELALLIAQESGKPFWEAETEVSGVIAKANLSIQAYQERCLEKETTNPDATSHLRYKPHGVVAGNPCGEYSCVQT
jgi:succinylglutamic semialdehyde dehydrogenase